MSAVEEIPPSRLATQPSDPFSLLITLRLNFVLAVDLCNQRLFVSIF